MNTWVNSPGHPKKPHELKKTSMWAAIKVLGNQENIRQREFVKTFMLVTSAVFTRQPVLHKICSMYPTCKIWTPLLAGYPSEHCRSPWNNPPLKVLGPRGCSTWTTNIQQMSGWCREIALHLGIANIQHSSLTIRQVVFTSEFAHRERWWLWPATT